MIDGTPNPRTLTLGRKLLPEPHPCGICQTRVCTSLPTCSAKECRDEWRKRAARLRAQARRDFLAKNFPNICGECRKQLTQKVIDEGYKFCGPCRARKRKEARRRADDKAHALYVQKIALARAERLIEQRTKEAARKKAEAEAKVEKIFGPTSSAEFEEF